MNKRIIVKKPEITYTGQGTVRLSADILEPGKPVFHSFVEVEKQYERYLSDNCSDYLLCLTFPVAIREGYDIECEAPVTETLLHNFNEILIPHYLIGDSRAKHFEIYADTVSELTGGTAVGTAVSCGVDSLYSIMEYTKHKYPSMKLTHLFVAAVNAELWNIDGDCDFGTWQEKHKTSFERYEYVSKMTGLPLVKVFTNVSEYSCALCTSSRDFVKYTHVVQHFFITMASVLALRRMWKIYYFPSTVNFVSHFPKDNWLSQDTAHFDCVNMHVLTMPDFQCFCGNAAVDRIEKTRRLADYEIAQKTLHPCMGRGKTNCSSPRCNKCLRALLALDYYDKLESMAEVFDIERYKNYKEVYLRELVKNRGNDFLSKLYEMMCEKYPEQMKKLTKEHEERLKPVSRDIYDDLAHNYLFALKISQLSSPKETICNFFVEKGIKKLYCIGTSNMGNMIISLIKDKVEIITDESKILDCDAIYILTTLPQQINNIVMRINVKTKGSIPLYQLSNIENYCNNAQ